MITFSPSKSITFLLRNTIIPLFIFLISTHSNTALHHRKLISHVDPELEDICMDYCSERNFVHECLPQCVEFCPSTCYSTEAINPSASPYSIENQRLSRFVLFCVLPTWLFFSFIFLIYKIFRLFSSSSSSSQTNEPKNAPPQTEKQPTRSIATVGLVQPAATKTVTVCKYKKNIRIIKESKCAVCLIEFEDNDTVKLLSCNHGFHINCTCDKMCPRCLRPVKKGAGNLMSITPVVEKGSGDANGGSGSRETKSVVKEDRGGPGKEEAKAQGI